MQLPLSILHVMQRFISNADIHINILTVSHHDLWWTLPVDLTTGTASIMTAEHVMPTVICRQREATCTG